MNPFAGLEEKAVAVVRNLIAEAEQNVPQIEAALADALHEAGVPPEIAGALGGLVKLLRDHFQADSAEMPPDTPDPAPEPEPEPVPGA
jgi:hypothetical protein